MPQELIQINARRPITRVFLLFVIVAATLWCVFVFRWYLGNTLAEYFNTAENSIDMAQLAISISPNDPLPHWRLGQVYQQKLTPDQIALIVEQYEKAVSLSPNDYRYWMSLGTALEQSGDVTRGEKALRQAVALAPAYALPRWYLGNLLLRGARYSEAFADLRLAAEADSTLRPQLFRLAFEIYGNDVAGLKSAIGDNPATQADFAMYLIQLQRVEDGLSIWDSLSEADRKANINAASSILNSLVGLHRYHDAMRVWNGVAPSDDLKAGLGLVVDGSLEQSSSHTGNVFAWQVNAGTGMQVGIDPEVAHNGTRSLRFVFKIRARLDSIEASTLVPVAPNTEYEFECYVRTEKLQGADTPYIKILNASDNASLGDSSQAPQGDNDWTRISLAFKTGDKAEAVKIQMARTPCEADKICPLFGIVWYDDFSIKRRN